MKNRFNNMSAFTLIELLVVISVIAILAGIALPVFGKVMEKARATSDASSLRQLGLGIGAYLNDNDEQIFKSDSTTPWPQTLQEKYVTNWKVFKSAFDKQIDGVGDKAPVSFGINEKVLTQTAKPAWDGNMSRLDAPSQLILMAPAMTTEPSTPKFVGTAKQNVSLPMPSGGTVKLGTHNGRSQISVLFADSHVASIPYLPATNMDAFTYITPESTGVLKGVIVKWEPMKTGTP